MPTVQDFHGSDVQEWKADPPIRIRKGNEDRALQQSGQRTVANFVSLSAGRLDEERFKRMLQEQLFDLVADHAGRSGATASTTLLMPTSIANGGRLGQGESDRAIGRSGDNELRVTNYELARIIQRSLCFTTSLRVKLLV
jgi:hypothetical protein